MARRWRLGIWCVCVFLLCLCWGACIGIEQQAAERPATASLRYSEAQLTSAQVDAMRKVEEKRTDGVPVLLTAWYQQGTAKISAADGKQINAQSVCINGSPGRLFPGELLSGQWLSEEDQAGCMISADTAYRLYGSTLVDGLELKIDGKAYQVRGVLRHAKNAVVLNAKSQKKEPETENQPKQDPNKEKIFQHITIEITDGKNPSMATQEFSVRHGIPNPPITIVSTFSAGAVKYLSSLAGAALTIAIMLQLVRIIWSVRMNNMALLVWSVALVAITGILVWSVGNRFFFPESMIPSKWSDFEFWNRTFKSLVDEASQFMQMEKYKPDEGIWKLLSQQVFLSAATVSIMGVVIWLNTKVKDTGLFMRELLCIILAFSAVVVSVYVGIPLGTSRGYWVLLPLLLALPAVQATPQ